MSLLVKSAIGVSGLAAAMTAVFAADMPSTRPVELPQPTYVRSLPASVLSGWYVRGDLGYRWGRVSGSEPAPGFPAPNSEKLGQAYAAGLGVGLRSDWLRADATIDIASPMKYQGTTATANDTTA